MADQAAENTARDGHPEPTIEHKEAFIVAGLRYEGKNEHGEIPALWEEFLPRVGQLIADPSRFEAFGVARALPEPPEPGVFGYLAGVRVGQPDQLPPGMVAWEIPALTVAVLSAHDVAGIGPAIHYFHHEWLPQSQAYEYGEGLMVEHYPETFGQDLIIYLWFPVRPKSQPPC